MRWKPSETGALRGGLGTVRTMRGLELRVPKEGLRESASLSQRREGLRLTHLHRPPPTVTDVPTEEIHVDRVDGRAWQALSRRLRRLHHHQGDSGSPDRRHLSEDEEGPLAVRPQVVIPIRPPQEARTAVTPPMMPMTRQKRVWEKLTVGGSEN